MAPKFGTTSVKRTELRDSQVRIRGGESLQAIAIPFECIGSTVFLHPVQKSIDDRIVVHLRDGALGDDDRTANGVIVDPGAPVINVSSSPHQNPLNRFDVSEEGDVSALDALRIINELNRNGGNVVLDAPLPGERLPFYDVNGDNTVSAIDALQIINELNRIAVEGDPAAEEAIATRTMTSTTALDVDANATVNPIVAARPLESKWTAQETCDHESPSDLVDVDQPKEINRSVSDSEWELVDSYFRSLGRTL
ncbi:MAG: dockerin type I domain-containing protein [Planctomycetota bacterium]